MRLLRIAHIQNKTPYFAEVRKDANRIHNLLAKYHEVCPDTSSKPRAAFNISEYSEFETSSTSVIKDRDVVMLYEKRFLAYAQSIEGGGASGTPWLRVTTT